jgi:hypothetical protein
MGSLESVELVKKLQIKAGQRLWLVNVPNDMAETLTAGAEVEIAGAGEACDGVIAFVHNPAEVENLAKQALKVLPRDGLLWLAYRKGAAGKAAGLTRDTGWASVKAAGWDTVRSVSLDDAWTGLRFRAQELIKR